MIRKEEITRIEFVSAVRQFKTKYQVKLKDLLKVDGNPAILKDFWSNPIIRGYLGRASVLFIEKHPALNDSSNKEDHETSDHYELKIYKYLPNVIPYRNAQITNSEFYTTGTFYSQKDIFGSFFTALNKNERYIVHTPMSLDAIVYISTRNFYNSGSYKRFNIFPNWELDNKHAINFVTILAPNKMPLAVIMLDSEPITITTDVTQINKAFHNLFFREIFLDEKIRPTSMEERIIKYFNSLTSIDIQDPELKKKDPTMLIFKEQKAVFLINQKNRYEETDECKQILALNDIKVIYIYKLDKMYDDARVLTVNYKPDFPFIPVSCNLQIDENDNNCVLYGLNFAEAVTNLLSDNNQADAIYDLACSATTNSQSIDTLNQIFQENLKKYLPCYYDPSTLAEKSHAEIEIFHLNQRWSLGNKFLTGLHSSETRLAEENHDNNTQKTINKKMNLPFFSDSHSRKNNGEDDKSENKFKFPS